MNAAPLPNLTLTEQRTYELAVRLWRAAGFKVRTQSLVHSTLGAIVTRTRGVIRRAA